MMRAAWFLVLGFVIGLGLIALGFYLEWRGKRDGVRLPPPGTRLRDLTVRSAARRAEVQTLPDGGESGLDDRRPRARVRDGHGRVLPWPQGTDFADDDPFLAVQLDLAERLIALREEAQRKGMH